MTPAEARRLFARERDRFEATVGAWRRRRSKPSLRIADRPFILPEARARRDVAYTTCGRRQVVVVLRRLLAMPRAVVIGVIRHELGHAYDPYLGWPGGERRADRVAEAATGQPIHYNRQGLQTTGRGARRPAWLHQ